MPTFDVKFSELQAKLTAGLAMLVAEFPEAAARMREVIDTAVADAEVEATVQADEARANAIATLITGAGQMLAAVAPDPPVEPLADPPADPEVQP